MSFVVSAYLCAIHKETSEDELTIPLFVKKGMDSWLDGLGFNTHTPGTSYGENGRSAYNAYWESRFPELFEEGVIEKIINNMRLVF